MDPRVERLYELRPGDFTAARNELAKALKAEGSVELAREVARMARPAWPLWGVNQLVRRAARDVKALLDAGARLRQAHQRIMAGGAAPGELRDVGREHQELLTRLQDRAMELLEEAGAGSASVVQRRIRATLHAVSIGSDELRERFTRGTLDQELEPPDAFDALGALAAGEGSPPPPPPPRAAREQDREPTPAEQRAEDRRRAAEAKARAREEELAAQARARERAAAEQRVAEVRARAAELDEKADALDRKAASLREEARALRDEARTLRASLLRGS